MNLVWRPTRMQVAVEICPGQVPILDGAQECSRQGVASSLYAQNALVQDDTLVNTSTAGELFPLLVDPQTGGHAGLSCNALRASTACMGYIVYAAGSHACLPQPWLICCAF